MLLATVARMHPVRLTLLPLGVALWLPCFCPQCIRAQGRDVGAGANPAASAATMAPDTTGVLDGGQSDAVVVIGSLDEKRNDIVPNLGATSYGISQTQIQDQSQGADAPFNQTLLRVPGFAQDSYGQLHVRGEHANLQYRINDVLLPEGIAGFGQELDTRFVDNLQVVTGSLPAQYGVNTAGVIDIHTKSGAFNDGDELGLYGGSYNTYRPSAELSGSSGKFNYYFTGDFFTSGIGIENPAGTNYPIHDQTDQDRGFGYLSYIIDHSSRLSLILSGYAADFQIPNNPGQPPAFQLQGVPAFASAHLDENQNEQNYYAVLAYQKSAGPIDYQLSFFLRDSSILFTPDTDGDLIYNGVASRLDRYTFTGGTEFDADYHLNAAHTLRGGYVLLEQQASSQSATDVFATNPATGAQSSNLPERQILDQSETGDIYGVYLQDEWKLTRQWTVNYGARYDHVDEYVDEGQLSPRLNTVYQLTPATTLHAGYSRYFTPPPLESVESAGIRAAANTTNAPQVFQNSPDKSERANYFDAGVTQTALGSLQLGLDGYYKRAVQQLDEGQFGTAIVESPFNYRYGEIYGLEGTLTYVRGGFEAYANAAYSSARGKAIDSSQFLFSAAELAYINTHYIYLDHDQTSTVSAGLAYHWKPEKTRVYTDFLYGSGLRDDFANTGKVPADYTLNIGFEKGFHVEHLGEVKARFDVVNLLDQVYQLRNGSGVGVEAPQYGQRRGLYGGFTLDFGAPPAAK
jgi:outer membrane receptor protein involved in Fe transport